MTTAMSINGNSYVVSCICDIFLFLFFALLLMCARAHFFLSLFDLIDHQVNVFVSPISIIIITMMMLMIFCPSPSQLKLEKVLLKLYKNIDGFLSDFIKRFIIRCIWAVHVHTVHLFSISPALSHGDSLAWLEWPANRISSSYTVICWRFHWLMLFDSWCDSIAFGACCLGVCVLLSRCWRSVFVVLICRWVKRF